MVAFTKKVLLIILGWFFILLGIIGLFLPFLEGILFIVIGLIILSKQSKTAKSIVNHFKEKHPRPFQLVSAIRRRLSNRFHRWVSR